jgi:hypothetical protein
MTGDQVRKDTAKERNRDLVPSSKTSPAFEINAKFEVLRGKLRKQFPFVAGVAFCQRGQ